MPVIDILLVAAIAIVAGSAFTSIGVLLEFSLRKKVPHPSAKPRELAEEIAQPPTQQISATAPESAPLAAPKVEARGRVEPSAAPKATSPEPSVSRPSAPVQAPSAAPTAAPPIAAPTPVAPKRLDFGLRRTRESFLSRIRAAITGKAKLDEIYEGLEEALIAADVGVEAGTKLVEAVRIRLKLKGDARPDLIRDALKTEIAVMLTSVERPPADSGAAPLVVMLVGVNGAGKTTTVAKLAAWLKVERGSVIVAAADTFRAAAIEQLEVWCARVGVDVIKQAQGSDPAAVAFDAVKAAVARKAGAVIIDTAGRLQTKVNLMEELKKIARVVGRELPSAPHETFLVLDATTGQNALSQAKIFGEAVPLTGVILAKLDSTAKGGVIVGIADRLKLPVRFVGIGENIEDLRPFDAAEFVDALFSGDEAAEPRMATGSYAA